MPRLAAVAVLAFALLAGCSRPLAAGAEPDRPSVHVEPALFDGKPLWLNGTAHVSPLPPDAGDAATPGEPHNCLVVREADDERDSYLGGVLVELEWAAASSATTDLNLTVSGLPEGVAESWSLHGPSPLRLVADAGDERPLRTPFVLRLAAPAAPGGVPLPEQPVAYRVMVGVLESDLRSLGWTACSSLPLPVA